MANPTRINTPLLPPSPSSTRPSQLDGDRELLGALAAVDTSERRHVAVVAARERRRRGARRRGSHWWGHRRTSHRATPRSTRGSHRRPTRRALRWRSDGDSRTRSAPVCRWPGACRATGGRSPGTRPLGGGTHPTRTWRRRDALDVVEPVTHAVDHRHDREERRV